MGHWPGPESLDGVVGRLEEGARVGERGAEHQLVEAVGDVVVVADRLGVAGQAVPETVDHLIGEGALGRKAGRGFFRYDP